MLIHSGIMKGKTETAKSVMLDMPSADCFTFAEHEGLFEICADLGDTVSKGQVIAKVWPIERTGCAPAVYLASMDGLVTARHFPGLIKMGDCMVVLSVEMQA